MAQQLGNPPRPARRHTAGLAHPGTYRDRDQGTHKHIVPEYVGAHSILRSSISSNGLIRPREEGAGAAAARGRGFAVGFRSGVVVWLGLGASPNAGNKLQGEHQLWKGASRPCEHVRADGETLTTMCTTLLGARDDHILAWNIELQAHRHQARHRNGTGQTGQLGTELDNSRPTSHGGVVGAAAVGDAGAGVCHSHRAPLGAWHSLQQVRVRASRQGWCRGVQDREGMFIVSFAWSQSCLSHNREARGIGTAAYNNTRTGDPADVTPSANLIFAGTWGGANC